MSDDALILDAGCGENGLAGFLPGKKVIGLDVLQIAKPPDDLTYIQGSILALPFSARSIPLVASVDALEHLPDDLRADAITEMVRVADEAIVVSFPSGSLARDVDEAFNRNLTETNMPVPDWLTEHLAAQYPEIETVLSAVRGQATKLGRVVETSVYYSERIEVTKFLRWAAVRSRYLYIVSNFFLGIVMPVFVRPEFKNSYRSILLVRFRNT